MVIGRYISENYDGVALHPIDFIDTSTGKLVAEVIDTDVTTISPVNKLHPQDHILASGSSRFVAFLSFFNTDLPFGWCITEQHFDTSSFFPLLPSQGKMHSCISLVPPSLLDLKYVNSCQLKLIHLAGLC